MIIRLLLKTITKDFKGAAITIFTARCGYCKGAKQLLNEKEIAYFEVDVKNTIFQNVN